jgi:hypothetical protein
MEIRLLMNANDKSLEDVLIMKVCVPSLASLVDVEGAGERGGCES